MADKMPKGVKKLDPKTAYERAQKAERVQKLLQGAKKEVHAKKYNSMKDKSGWPSPPGRKLGPKPLSRYDGNSLVRGPIDKINIKKPKKNYKDI
jgi:hypothetical protein